MTIEGANHWDGVYATKSETEVSWFQPIAGPSLELVDRLAIPTSASFIDVGGGSSRLVDAMLARGFRDLTVLDLSAVALAAAEKRLGPAGDGVEWIVADATEWEPKRTWDVWHDRAAFHFLVTDDGRQAYVRRLHRALTVGGHAIIATFALDGPEKCSGLPVWRYDALGLATVLGDAFALVTTVDRIHVTPAGNNQKFQFSVFRRTA